MIFDYETFRIVWWAILGLACIGFAVSCGFDLGVVLLLPYLGDNESDRVTIIDTVSITWIGSQVWLVLVVGVLFSAWPLAFSITFSSLYLVLLFILFSFLLRPLGIVYRSELSSLKWRQILDKVVFIEALVATLFFGIALGNLFVGIPFHLENDMLIVYLGNIWGLLNPFGLLIGLLSLSLFIMQGAIYLQMKTEGTLNQRAKSIALRFTILTLVIFALAGFFVSFMDGYHISSKMFSSDVSNPLLKTVRREPGLWLDNYGHFSKLWLIPFSTFISGYIVLVLSRINRPASAFLFSLIVAATMIITAGCTLFPFLSPSTISLNSSLTIWDSSASYKTLSIMFWMMVILLPLVLLYVGWVYKVLCRNKTVEKNQNNHSAKLG